MGLFVLEYSVKKQMQSRSLDAAMLKAMINVNAPTKNSEQMLRRNQTSSTATFPIFTSKQNAMSGEAAKYKAYKWLLV
jgi:hypothetical protein